jgi:lycopene cyclase domain-containing protein
MRHLTYLGVLGMCLLCAGWVEPVFRVGVLRRWRLVIRTLVPVALVFSMWDVAAIAAGQWSYDPGQVAGFFAPGHLPLEEVLFFVVIPFCAILGFEAVRKVTGLPVRPDRCTTKSPR